MKILKYGEGYPKTCTCGKCKSELEYDFSDIYSWNDLLDEIVTTGVITCPVCGETIEVYKYFRPRYDDPKKKLWWQYD